MVHRLLAAAEGYIPLPEEYKGKDFMKESTEVIESICYSWIDYEYASLQRPDGRS